MARRYKRYRRRNDDTLGGGIVLLLLVLGSGIWQLQKEGSPLLIYISAAGILLVILIGVFIFLRYRQTQRKLRALDIAAIDTMDPLEFEVYVAKLLKNQGFSSIKLTERYDYGVDILAQKDGINWGIQVKRYSSLVKAEAVRQVVTALIRYKCDRSMVVTNSTFSRPARELASDNKCVLVDRDLLAEWILEFQNTR